MTLETDYLVIGAGALGMAFVDTLLAESDATITIVDRGKHPGGHWTMAYPFVRLHQPSRYYGVASRPLELSEDTPDGFAHHAAGPQIQSYFQAVMDDVFLPSGRVTYLPLSEMQEDKVVCLRTGETQDIKVNRKIVEAGNLGGLVPAQCKPGFPIDSDVDFVPINALDDLADPAENYVVLGSGKTGIDACLRLLDGKISPDRITWVMPRDSWFLDRRMAQPTEPFFELKVRVTRDQGRALLEAKDAEDLFDKLEACGSLLRLDPNVRPTAYKCATVTHEELDRLRTIEKIVRKGHVTAISPTEIKLTGGVLPIAPDARIVDCTASGIPDAPEPPIFRPGRIVPNGIRSCQPTFCAALIAHLEATIDDNDTKNELCKIVPMPREPLDWLRMEFVNRQNQYAWLQSDDLRVWLKNCRLDVLTNVDRPQELSDEVTAMLGEIKASMIPSTMRLKQILDEAERA